MPNGFTSFFIGDTLGELDVSKWALQNCTQSDWGLIKSFTFNRNVKVMTGGIRWQSF